MELDGSHNASVTTLTLADEADAMGAGQLLRIDDEIVEFTGFGRVSGHRTSTKLNVVRGREGSTAASHSSGAEVTPIAAYHSGDRVEAADRYSGASSRQTLAGDLDLTPAAGKDHGDSAFLAGVMGNVMGDSLTKDANYLAGVIGADSITGTQATGLPKAGVIGMISDGVTESDAAVLAVLDGSDPSAETRAHAAFAVKVNNNDAGSGFDFGLDLQDAGRSSDYYTGGGVPAAYALAPIRLTDDVCFLVGAGVPDATVGDGVAGPGSIYIRTGAGTIYVNAGSKATPSWKLVTQAA